MKSIFYRTFTIAVELLVGLVVTVLLTILVLPDILCPLLRAPRRVLTVLMLLAGFSAFIGCSSKHPEPEKPSEIHWHGPATGYEDTTKPGDQPSFK